MERTLKRIADNCVLMHNGWNDRVEYEQAIKYHTTECDTLGGCDCPTKNEKRAREVKRPGLLEQLKEYQQNKDVNRNPKAARGAPKIKTPKMHPELNGYLTLDEITCDAYMTLDRVLEEAGRDRLWLAQSLKGVFQGLHYQVAQFSETHPDLVHEVDKALNRWINQAKTTLHMTVADAMFANMVCENCNGALAIAWDNSTDIRCIGSPSDPPCGHTYPRSEWITLYEKGKK
ncbi:hypothetical protein ACFWPU_00915 [Streptomyces sp. NPDC058471]|uniref:hypothetical protein n=1 Tax=Streptomyces sp. NPDC058471 TaxID=3346516 RepID=UPI00364D9EAA